MNSVNIHLQYVENLLNLLIDDLAQLEQREVIEAYNRDPQPADRPQRCEWKDELEAFRVKASTIRKIMDHFHGSDLSTRRYLRQHLDEEFASLKNAYDSLRQQFTSAHEKSLSAAHDRSLSAAYGRSLHTGHERSLRSGLESSPTEVTAHTAMVSGTRLGDETSFD